ncbi:MAG TPA: type II secretion system F family protein [Erysipelothrix sp.]|nr:type II secretion system F family protein [Erysipelothrix sp.]
MKSYKVNMIDKTGKTIKETIPAESEHELIENVKEMGNYLLNFEEVVYEERFGGKLNLGSLVVFTYQLSAMLSAGVNIIDALRMIQIKAANDKERKIYRNLYEEVQKGNSLSSAMMDQGGAFDHMLISMVKSGESSGSVDEVLATMADQYERDKEMNQKLKTASIYPLILFIVSIVVVLILVTFVLPGIMDSFPDADVPLLTQILMKMSNFILTKWYILIGILGGLGFVVYVLLNTHHTRVAIDKTILNIPKIGPLLRTVYSARCARSFASLYSHGVPALEMIELTGDVLGNKYLEEQFDQVYIDVSRGELISTSIDEVGEFDTMLSAMISVGEETGDLEGILSKTADYFDKESEAALTRLVSLIEPIMIIWMGVMVGLIVVSILQPMFSVYENIG